MATITAASFAAYAAAASAAAAVGTGVYSAVQANKAGERNAEIAEQEAEQAKQISLINAEQQAKSDRRLAAAQRARFGAAGIDIGRGSALNLLSTTSGEAELDRQRLLAGGTIESARLRRSAGSASFEGSARAQQAVNQGFSGFLGGISQAARSYGS